MTAQRPWLFISILAAVSPFVGGGCADQLMLAPSTARLQSTRGAAPVQVPLGKGKSIEIWTAPTEAAQGNRARAYVLRFCGNGERAEEALRDEQRLWAGVPVEIWAVNYPGFGGSTGPARLEAIPNAALSSFDALADRAAGRPIMLSGFSLGGTVALYVAAHRPAASGLLLRAVPPVRDVIMGNYGWWNLWLLAGPLAGQFPRELDSVANARRVVAPAVFVVTGNDHLVPRRFQREVTAAHAGKKRVIIADDAQHDSPIVGKTLQKLEIDLQWLFSKATASRAAPH